MVFLAPILLSGLALASIPIIIHLLNRRRFLRIDWAPMRYLKLTIKTNRRRLRIEQLILLAVRTLAILVLFFAVARPVLSQSGVGAWLGGRSRTARVIVIDDSSSMGYLAQRRAGFDTAKDATIQLLKSIGAQDSVTLLTTSAPDAPLIREAHLDDPAKVLAEIAKLPLSDTASNWGQTLKAVDTYLSGAALPIREVVLVTDQRRSGWGGDVTEIANRWAGQYVKLKVIDVGSRDVQNVALSSFEQEDAIALPDEPVNLKAQVRNDGAPSLEGTQAALKLGDETRPLMLPNLPPGKTTDVSLTVNRQQPGQYPVFLKLPGDNFPQDDVRWMSLTVRQNLEMSLIDGELSAQPFESTTDFLATAFTVGHHPWRIQRSGDSDWSATAPSSTDVMVLANIASVSPERAATIEQLVHNGMGLMIFMGEQVDPQLYNQRLYREGQGLLPCRIDRPLDGPVTGMFVEQVAQSPIASMAKLAPEALTRIVAKRFMGVSMPQGKSQEVRTLARWNDQEGHPAIVEKRFGKGSVLLWTMTADKKWSDWPVDPTYVLAVRSAAMTIARGERQQDNLIATQPLVYQLPAGQAVIDARVAAPGDPAPHSIPAHADKAGTVLRYDHTIRAGIYTMSWKDAAGKEQSHQYSVNGDKAESDLEPIADDQLKHLLGNLQPPIIHYGAQAMLSGPGREIWRTLAMTLMGLLLVETLLAVWVGRER